MLKIDPAAPIQLLGSISPGQFLKEYWQKKPLLIRQAIPHYQCPIEADDLAGLALEKEVESRIVLESDQGTPWVLKNGPFTEQTFEQLPETNWTLLIQQLDAWAPEVNELKSLFSFIPNWRIDDIMASYAPQGGSVGPHFDQYDVFLLQAYGRRHWRLGQSCDSQTNTRDDTQLSILTEFEESASWVLEPGDLLYVPPGLAHYGVAEDECITLSVGFRAPAQQSMLSQFTDYVLEHAEDKLYADPDLCVQDSKGELAQQSIKQLQELMLSAIQDDALFEQWLGCFLTEPKNPQIIIPTEQEFTWSDFEEALQDNLTIEKNEGSRFSYSHTKLGLRLYVDGHNFDLSQTDFTFVQYLCDQEKLGAQQIAKICTTLDAKHALCALVNHGGLLINEGDFVPSN
jgi:50S ribosomal protein L16 3-hydroxylase